MNDWLLIATSVAVLYGLWLLLNFVFQQIERYHAAWREERTALAEPRTFGVELSEERDQ